MNYTGDRILGVGRLGAPNEIEKPPISLDFNYARSFEIWDGLYEFSVKGQNLLNDKYKITQGGLIAEEYDLGVSFSIGIKTTF